MWDVWYSGAAISEEAIPKGKWTHIAVPYDGEGRRHDQVNACSQVALVESSAQRVLVSWRYLPQFGGGNPYEGIEPTRKSKEVPMSR